MIYEFMPQKNVRKLAGMLSILISATVGFFLFTSLFPTMPLRWLFQLSGFVCIGIVIFIAARYIGKNLVYGISEGENGLDFTVTEVTNGGRSRVIVMRFALSEVESVEFLGNDSGKKKLLSKRVKKERRPTYNYCAEMGDPNTYCVFFTQNGTHSLLKLSPDSVILDYLTKKAENTEEL